MLVRIVTYWKSGTVWWYATDRRAINKELRPWNNSYDILTLIYSENVRLSQIFNYRSPMTIQVNFHFIGTEVTMWIYSSTANSLVSYLSLFNTSGAQNCNRNPCQSLLQINLTMWAFTDVLCSLGFYQTDLSRTGFVQCIKCPHSYWLQITPNLE